MIPQFAAGICSLFGAIFFFGGGYFFARYRLSFDQGKFEHEILASKQREDAVREKAIQDNLSFKRNIDMLKQKSDAYQKATRKRISELKGQVVELDSVIGDYRERLSDLAVEITRADSENALLVEALETTKKDLKDIFKLEQENLDLTRKLERLKEFDGLKKENQRLKEQLSNQKIASLSSHGARFETAGEDQSGLLPSPEVIQSEMPASHERLEKDFESMVNQISQLDGSRGVVVADGLGLLIAGTGEHMDSMAAMGAIYSMVDSKITPLIPFGEIDVIKVQNLENLTVTMHPVNINSEKLILATLTTGKGPDRRTLNRFSEPAVAT